MIDWVPIQKRLGLVADGAAGPVTYAALFGILGNAASAAEIKSLGTAASVHFPTFGITDTVDRLGDFLAQTANETGGYTVFEEDLRYSADRMLVMWPAHFTPQLAAGAVGNPQRIAEIAYGIASKTGHGRMGNVLPGGGYLFRGRGMLQLTGRANYDATNRRLGIGIDAHPDIASIPALSLLIACEFYKRNKVLEACDAKDFTQARKITNGGDVGLDHVNLLRAKIMKVLAG